MATGTIVAPVMAAQGPAGNGPGNGVSCQNDGKAGQGTPMRRGKKARAKKLMNTKASGTLTSAQKKQLAWMAEEEKVAHDVYVTLAASYPDVMQFSRIPNSETRHLQAVQRMLTKYGLDDPTTGMGIGKFKSATAQNMFDESVAAATSRQAALDVGLAIEKQDIADLKAAKVGLKAPDVRFVYNRLLQGSYNHLRAFGG